MARTSALALAALLMLPIYGRAAEMCFHAQAQQARPQQAQPQAATPDAKNGRGDERQPPPHWWSDPQLRQQLAITDSQSKQVEEIWQKSLPDLRKLWHQLNALEEQASKMILEGAPEAAVTAQIEQTESTRAQANKARTLLIYRMYKVLTPDQRAKVTAIAPPLYERRDGRRGGGPR